MLSNLLLSHCMLLIKWKRGHCENYLVYHVKKPLHTSHTCLCMCLILLNCAVYSKSLNVRFLFFLYVMPKVLIYTLFFYQNRRMNNAEKSSDVDMLQMHIPASKFNACLSSFSTRCILTKDIHNLRKSLKKSSEEGSYCFNIHDK